MRRATEKQVNYIWNLQTQAQSTLDHMTEWLTDNDGWNEATRAYVQEQAQYTSLDPTQLSSKKASELIDKLKALAKHNN